MRTHEKLILTFSIIAATISFAHAEADLEMTAKLHGLYPNTKFQQVNKTSFPGLTEVVMGQNIAYVDQTGRYFLFGKLYDMKTQQDLTQGRMEEVQKVDMSRFDKSLAIKRVKGDGSRTLYLFSDPECPYCKQLEKSVVNLDNVTIYTFMMPLTSIHPQAHAKAVSIWCAKNKGEAWDDLMLKNKEPKAAECDNPVDQVVTLASSMNVNGTPTMFDENGRRMSGARDSAAISSWLDNVAPKKTAAKE